VVNTLGSTLSGTDGLGDWNIPWEQWKAGNALSGSDSINAKGAASRLRLTNVKPHVCGACPEDRRSAENVLTVCVAA
jgi:hypothetical protein